jgi:curved DNA-binding protein CbpA
VTDPSADAEFDAYKTLQVDPEADPEVIQAAFRRLAQKWHPDVTRGGESATRMIAINRAWELLGDPARRVAYDRERARRLARSNGGASQPGTAAGPQRPGGQPAAGRTASSAGARTGQSRPSAEKRPPPPEEVSRDWTSGRSSTGSGYDPASMRTADGEGAAGRPPGNPSGSLLNFGRYTGWSLGEIARADLEYIEWLDRTPIGRPYREEIDVILRRAGRRKSADAESVERRGLFRRR